MKSIRISLMLFFLILTSVGFAQLKIGIKFSPGITPVRTSVTSDNIQVNEERSPLRMMAGLVVDYGNSDNYEFRSGINFIAKRYKYDLVFGAPGVNYSDEINMQYIQVPLTLKLNTNEVMLD